MRPLDPLTEVLPVMYPFRILKSEARAVWHYVHQSDLSGFYRSEAEKGEAL